MAIETKWVIIKAAQATQLVNGLSGVIRSIEFDVQAFDTDAPDKYVSVFSSIYLPLPSENGFVEVVDLTHDILVEWAQGEMLKQPETLPVGFDFETGNTADHATAENNMRDAYERRAVEAYRAKFTDEGGGVELPTVDLYFTPADVLAKKTSMEK